MQTVDVIVVGAGAAGLMCAIEAGRRGRRVLLLDHADRPGKKILISGGGRCNFTNLRCGAENFVSENPHFARSALARYTPADFLAMVEQHGIAYHEKTLGQLFCDRSAQAIVTMLERECATARVKMLLGTRIAKISQAAQISGADAEQKRRRGERFLVETSRASFSSASVVVATGGLSIPKLGATGFGYEIARQFGLRVVHPRPALVPLTLAATDRERWSDLAGVSVAVACTTEARRPTPTFRERLLITHRGLSGPAALQISTFWQPGTSVTVDLAPEIRVTEGFKLSGAERNSAELTRALKAVLPARFAERWTDLHPPPNWKDVSLAEFERTLHAWEVFPDGTEGFAKAEVTAGGVDTSDLVPQTLESRDVPGLFFIGEVVDVTGWLGGYNFQWAWASGACAGRVA